MIKIMFALIIVALLSVSSCLPLPKQAYGQECVTCLNQQESDNVADYIKNCEENKIDLKYCVQVKEDILGDPVPIGFLKSDWVKIPLSLGAGFLIGWGVSKSDHKFTAIGSGTFLLYGITISL